MKTNQLEDYYLYLEKVTAKIDSFFMQQKPYIFCKEGCSKCCQNGEYPCSELEFSFLLLGFAMLENETKNKIIEKTKLLKELNAKNPNKIFKCECPFLINNKCSVYKFRPIICRTFGLPYYDKNKKVKIPFCYEFGLNYSQVYDKEKQILSDELQKQAGIKQEPLAFNLSLSFLINQVGKEGMQLDFGEQKTIPDWMISWIK